MRTFYILLLFYSSFLCYSQSPGASVPVVLPVADSLYFIGQFKEAIPYYEQFLKSDNSLTPLAYYRLAYAYHQNGNIDKAIISYQTCLSKNPNINLARVSNVNLSKAYSLNNRIDSANACLHRAISMGYANLNDLESSPDFNKFRTSPEYGKVHDLLFNAAYPCIHQAEARQFDFWV
ncbi:MAG: tetratricopeptide repeat protein, partial [Saprospiraceae bacterium]